ncbi:MAG: dihydropteroate synthase [Gammaproteobacteria bacterium]|nr:MAG: dihydropteroate synthase [Gammaproteobacteria bacterium]
MERVSRRTWPRAGEPPLVMGILNVTPDSFADAGRYSRLDAAVAHAEAMVAAGADIIDIGGESTRPGASLVAESAEIDRVVPVIRELARRTPCLLSVDTSKPNVMRAAVDAGAGMINDVCALRRQGAEEMAAGLGVPICIMHMQGEPASMQAAPAYRDVVAEVKEFLVARVAACEAAGIPRGSLLIDPGFGFGKDLSHNLQLLRSLREFTALGLPVLVGLSRKSMIGALTGKPVGERLHGSVALAVYAALQGASVVRVHDVGPTVEALRVIGAVMGARADE